MFARMWETLLKQHLRALVEIYRTVENCAPSRISQGALNDRQFIDAVLYAKPGKGFTIRSYDKVTAWLSANWPADVDWPESIPRPPVAKRKSKRS